MYYSSFDFTYENKPIPSKDPKGDGYGLGSNYSVQMPSISSRASLILVQRSLMKLTVAGFTSETELFLFCLLIAVDFNICYINRPKNWDIYCYYY